MNRFLLRLVPGLSLLALVATGPAHAWGAAGHRMCGEAAAAALPPAAPAFFRGAAAQLAYLNDDPDRWREAVGLHLDPALNAATAPEHYINLERVGESQRRASDRDAFLATVYPRGHTAAEVGLLPFRILEGELRLRLEFHLWRNATDAVTRGFIEQRIVDEAGLLGHYVCDGANPHHTTINFNGWIGAWPGDNPSHYSVDKTFHARFEELYVATHVTGDMVKGAMPKTPALVNGDLRAAIWRYLDDSHAQVEPLYQLEQRARFDADTQDPQDLSFAVGRLAAGATMLRDLWWTAWMTSAPNAAEQKLLQTVTMPSTR